jgi:hypothetical protein
LAKAAVVVSARAVLRITLAKSAIFPVVNIAFSSLIDLLCLPLHAAAKSRRLITTHL